MANERILVIDDDEDIINILRIYIKNEGFEFFSTSTFEGAQKIIKSGVDLIILDVLLPEKDGFDICLELRKSTTAPIIFLSCKSDEMDKIIGLSVGGDDYIAKPFLPGELMARIKSNIRRSKNYAEERQKHSIQLGELNIELINREVSIGSQSLVLLPKEYDILLLFARNPNRLFTKGEIFEYVWKDNLLESDLNTITVHISNLRKKMRISENAPQITTFKGIGYKLISK